MKTLRLIGRRLGQGFKQLVALPASVAKAWQQRKLQAGLHELEVERLDRIRHPEKYRGK